MKKYKQYNNLMLTILLHLYVLTLCFSQTATTKDCLIEDVHTPGLSLFLF